MGIDLLCASKCGGVAQLARANGSYPLGRWFEPTRRYHFGPLVKRLRHRPFTAVTRVQISYGSPYGSIAQLGEHLPYKQRVIGSSPIVPTKTKNTLNRVCFLFWWEQLKANII